MATKWEKQKAIALIKQMESLLPFSLRRRKAGVLVNGKKLAGWKELSIEVSEQIKKRYRRSSNALASKNRLVTELSSLYTSHPDKRVKLITRYLEEALGQLFAESQHIENRKNQESREAAWRRSPFSILGHANIDAVSPYLRASIKPDSKTRI